jgi:protein arginine N-methyltransferase 1
MPELYARHVGHQPQDTQGFDMSAARLLGSSGWTKTHAKTENLLTDARNWAELDFRTVTDPNVAAQIEWLAERPGTGHGFVAWFDTNLYQEIGFSNAPGQAPLLYGNAFFPWQEPVRLEAGDRITIKVAADLTDDDYTWRWNSVITRPGETQEVVARFKQSNLSAVRALRSLRARGGSHVPCASRQLEIDRFILGRIDGERSTLEIAQEVSDRFGDLFPSWDAAIDTVADLSSRYVR